MMLASIVLLTPVESQGMGGGGPQAAVPDAPAVDAAEKVLGPGPIVCA